MASGAGSAGDGAYSIGRGAGFLPVPARPPVALAPPLPESFAAAQRRPRAVTASGQPRWRPGADLRRREPRARRREGEAAPPACGHMHGPLGLPVCPLC